jgi:hypothetical protein
LAIHGAAQNCYSEERATKAIRAFVQTSRNKNEDCIE